MQKVITYKSLSYKKDKKHKRLLSEGWAVVSEEEIEYFDKNKGCCLAVIFFPLVLFAKSKGVKVVYERV